MSYFGSNLKKIRKIKKLSQEAFGQQFGISRAAIASYEEGRAEPKYKVMITIANHFSLSLDQLLAKELTVNELYNFDIFRHEFPEGAKPGNNLIGARAQETLATFITANQHDSYLRERENEKALDRYPRMHLPQKVSGKARAFEHGGHEMLYDNRGLSNGDILIGVLVDHKKIKDSHRGVLYTIVTEDGILTRRLASVGKQWEFHCDNSRYAPLTLSPSKILELWELKGVYSTNLQHPGDMEDRLARLEARLGKS